MSTSSFSPRAPGTPPHPRRPTDNKRVPSSPDKTQETAFQDGEMPTAGTSRRESVFEDLAGVSAFPIHDLEGS